MTPLSRSLIPLLFAAGLPATVAAQSTAASPQPELYLSLSAIANAYGPHQPAPVFFQGEDVAVKLTLSNESRQPVAVPDVLKGAGWVSQVTLTVSRGVGKEARPDPSLQCQMVRYQPLLRQPADQTRSELLPGERIETEWVIRSADGTSLPPGSYLAVADARRCWPGAVAAHRPFQVVEARDRVDQLNRLHHIAVRHRWAKRYREAVATLEELRKACPNSATPYSELGAVYRDQGHFAKAVECWESAIRLLEKGPPCPEEEISQIQREDWIAALKDRVNRHRPLP